MTKKTKENLGKCTICGELDEKTVYCNALKMSRKGKNCLNCDVYLPRNQRKSLTKSEKSRLRKGEELDISIPLKIKKVSNELINKDYKDLPMDTDLKHWMNEDD